MNSNKKILFLVEGDLMERRNVENVAKKMFHLLEQDYEIVAYGTTIYELYEEMSKDPFLSLVSYLKSIGKLVLKPGELSKQAFSQIYLVFDFDPHYQKYSDEAILKMLEFFDDETENGRIYINYPMFEAAFYIDDFSNPQLTFEKIKISDCCGAIFKRKVRELSCFGEKNHLDFTLSKTLDVWQSIKWNYKKLVYLIGKNELDYMMVLKKQIESKNSSKHEILVLSTFVLMIVDYNPRILQVIEEKYGL